MEDQIYGTVLTLAGQDAYARAATGQPVQYVRVAVGDGGGVFVSPTEDWTGLTQEVWSGAPHSVRVEQQDGRSVAVVEVYIPPASGGYWVREIGLFDPAGRLLVSCAYPASEKCAPGQGVSTEFRCRLTIAHHNANYTIQQYDPNVVTATAADVERLRYGLYGYNMDLAAEIIRLADRSFRHSLAHVGCRGCGPYWPGLPNSWPMPVPNPDAGPQDPDESADGGAPV